MNQARGRRQARGFRWIDRHIKVVVVASIVAGVALALVGVQVQDDEEVDFAPKGEIYTTQERVQDLFDPDSDIASATFLVEDGYGKDVLTRTSFLAWLEREDALRADNRTVLDLPLNERLVTGVDLDLGIEVDGIFSIADAVDQALPGGLEAASEADVKLALDRLLAPDAPTAALRSTLSQRATDDPGSVAGERVQIWRSPAFTAPLRYDLSSFDIEDDYERALTAEKWLREAQTTLRDGHAAEPEGGLLDVYGLGIDFGTEFEESAQAGGPFVFLAVALIVLVVGGLLRSYWAAAVVATSLAVTMMFYTGITALIGLETSPLLQLIVPISMISFGVDFFIHAAGRVREAQVEAGSRLTAYPIGMTAVFGAILVAFLTSAAAFISNASSGVEAITEFGVGAAVALGLAFVFLGIVAPKALLAIEERIGGRPFNLGLMVPYKIAFTVAALFAGITVTLTVVMPTIGMAATGVYLLAFVGLPYLLARRRNRRAAAKGVPLVEEVRGAGHGLQAAGTVVHFLARWRVITIPVVVGLAVLGVLGALRVESAFELKDMLPSTSDAVVSLEKADGHFGSRSGGPGYVLVEGDLTDPATLRTLEAGFASLDVEGAPFSRDVDGNLQTSPNAMTIVRAAMSSPVALDAVGGTSGTTITDEDGDGLPDTAEQVAAIYAYADQQGIPAADGTLLLRPDIVQRFLAVEDGSQATRLEALIPSYVDEELVTASWDALEAAAADLRDELGDEVTLSVSGEPITNVDGLTAFVDSMLVSLPIAILLSTLIAAAAMRSIRYALVSIVPIVLVVGWVYAFMFAVDLKINPITATIAAISIGVGIDYATHFTMRFREEYEGEPSRFPALRRAGEGTGGALALSALTSVIGFAALSLAPTPIFSTFGMLTAVMIVFALVVSLMVLPSLLLVVTPSRSGDERERLEEAVTGGRFPYDPHSRDTAYRSPTA